MPRGSKEKLKDILEKEIISGKMKPGERLEEAALTERFGVSRTPVREALLQLSSMGLIELQPRRGAVVVTLGLQELIEMFEIMLELEGLCCRFATSRATNEERIKLRKIHESSKQLVVDRKHDEYYTVNVEFHETIYRAARNKYLETLTMELRTRLAPYRRKQLSIGNRIEESFAEHEKILTAIEAIDPHKAEKHMLQHVRTQSSKLGEFMASLPTDLLKT